MLAVVGLVAGGIWIAAGHANRSVAITLASEQLHQTVDNVRGLYVSRREMTIDNTAAADCPGGAADFTSRLSCLGAFGRGLVEGAPGSLPYHGWNRNMTGGSVRITPRNVNFGVIPAAGETPAFGVQFLDLPEDVCVEMAVKNSTPDQHYKLKAVLFLAAGGGIAQAYVTQRGPDDWTLAGGRSNILPVTPTQAVAECSTAGGVEWVYALR